MKVAMLTDTSIDHANGVVTSIKEQVTALKEEGIDSIIISPIKALSKNIFKGLNVKKIFGVPLIVYPEIKIAIPPMGAFKIPFFIKKEKPTIFHAHTPVTLGFYGLFLSKILKKPMVATYHTLYEEYIHHLLFGKVKSLTNLLWKFGSMLLNSFHNLCNKTIAPTKEIYNYLKENGIKNAVVIPNGINFEKFKDKKEIDIRRKYKIPKDKKILLYVGRVSFEKRIDVLLKAFKEIDGKAFLLIVGKGPKLKEYKNLAKRMKLKNVIFAGFVPDDELPNYYEQCDIFVSPSDTETQGLTFIEAMHFGKPVIGSNQKGSNELIKKDLNGLKFKAGVHADLAEKLKILINNERLRKKFGNNSKKISKRYDIRVVIKKFVKLYEGLENESCNFY